jgi:hypothetical protein
MLAAVSRGALSLTFALQGWFTASIFIMLVGLAMVWLFLLGAWNNSADLT